eukprot:6191443-Pleurochrysis_carterae.AAC.1
MSPSVDAIVKAPDCAYLPGMPLRTIRSTSSHHSFRLGATNAAADQRASGCRKPLPAASALRTAATHARSGAEDDTATLQSRLLNPVLHACCDVLWPRR